MKFLLKIAAFLMGLAVVGALAAGGLVLTLLPALPTAQEIRDVQLRVPLRVYAANGELMAEFGTQLRTPVSIDQVPKTLIHAVLAAEDDSFYSHSGVDFVGVIRAAIENLQSGHAEQGASTITMQVARNFFLSREKTYSRKATEALLAFRLERMLSKDQILELYLNKIFLGARAYGFAAAARVYFGKSLDELTLAQTALLAGLPKAPSTDNPLVSPKRATRRRNYVLGRMYKLGYIDDAAFAVARNVPVATERHQIAPAVAAPYVAEMVRQYMVNKYGKQAYWMGFKVYTTVVPDMQHNANKALRHGLLAYSYRHGYRGPVDHLDLTMNTDSEKLDRALADYSSSKDLVPAAVLAVKDKSVTVYTQDAQVVGIPWEGLSWARPYLSANAMGPKPDTAADILEIGDIVYVRDGADGWRLTQIPEVQGAMVSLDPDTGAILALTGGFDFYLSQYNRITMAERQPGSNIKPFIYSAALKHGFTTASMVSAGPIVIEDETSGRVWRPQNYSGKFYGPMRLRTALMHSVNLAAIRVLRGTGVQNARQHIARFGFDLKSLPNGLSLALGSGTVRPIEVVRAFSVLANGGYLINPYFIAWIENRDGNIIEQAKPSLACGYCLRSKFRSPREQPLQAPRVISAANRFLVASMLRSVVQYGTGRRALKLGRDDLAGKTGTTNSFRDAWFSGFNGDLVTTVWMGFDDASTLGRGEAGSRAALPIWVDYMEEAMQGMPETKLLMPDDIVVARISPKTGKLLPDGASGGMTEYFRSGTLPNHGVPAGDATAQPGSPIGGGAAEGLF